MTAIVVYVLWLVRHKPMLAFWIGLSSQIVVFVVITGLMVLLGVKRRTSLDLPMPGGGKVSLGIDDAGHAGGGHRNASDTASADADADRPDGAAGSARHSDASAVILAWCLISGMLVCIAAAELACLLAERWGKR
jgi:hypothetical protein